MPNPVDTEHIVPRDRRDPCEPRLSSWNDVGELDATDLGRSYRSFAKLRASCQDPGAAADSAFSLGGALSFQRRRRSARPFWAGAQASGTCPPVALSDLEQAVGPCTELAPGKPQVVWPKWPRSPRRRRA